MLRSRVRRNVRKYGKPAVIIIDYLQLMNDPSYKDSKHRNLEISSISTSLKKLAKEIGCPVIALSQLNRNLENRADKRPMPADLRDSGPLEQDADVILFIYRDEVYYSDSEYRSISFQSNATVLLALFLQNLKVNILFLRTFLMMNITN
ncbi:DnaB-like helicase C-terminal domain-containing protein [Pasteurella oralis]|uniref:DnaB-like helicase C-terminal domain-containing protein n=1 Tax=Pasteurella oralis TaxID=1071947 RepID=A0ABW4NX81_9PAST